MFFDIVKELIFQMIELKKLFNIPNCWILKIRKFFNIDQL